MHNDHNWQQILCPMFSFLFERCLKMIPNAFISGTEKEDMPKKENMYKRSLYVPRAVH